MSAAVPTIRNPFGHVDLRVRDRNEATAFYGTLLPELGFTLEFVGQNFTCYAVEGPLPATAWFGFTEDKEHRPNLNRIALWVASRDEVDRAAEVVRAAGGRIESGPRDCKDYSPTYYAVFFDDPSGNCLEVYHRTD